MRGYMDVYMRLAIWIMAFKLSFRIDGDFSHGRRRPSRASDETGACMLTPKLLPTCTRLPCQMSLLKITNPFVSLFSCTFPIPPHFPSTSINKQYTTLQCSAFPPNYVHSLDSTHMLMTALRCKGTESPFRLHPHGERSQCEASSQTSLTTVARARTAPSLSKPCLSAKNPRVLQSAV